MPLWNEIEGQALNGMPLRKLLRSEGRTAWFSTEEAGEPAVLSLFEALNDEDAVEARLRAAAGLPHPNLLAIRKTGRGSVAEESLVYAVMEPFDQSLSEVLRGRPLTAEEMREVTESLLSGLEAVESAGLVHGHVEASGVLGVGDSIKLRSDCVRPRAGEGDAPALASLLFTAMTGRRLGEERDALQLPPPFAAVVRAGVGPAGSLAAMRRALERPPAEPPGAAASARPAADARAPAEPQPYAAAERGDVPTKRPPRRGVSLAALVLMAVVLAVLWHSMKRSQQHTPISGEAPAAAPQTPNPTAAASAPPNPSPAAAPSQASPTPADTPRRAAAAADAASSMGAAETVRPAGAPVSHEGGPRSQWRVIAYTYEKQSAAERKAAQLAAKFPQFAPQVFTPTGHGPFLVSLGGGMSRQEAFARREAARAAGLPSDTYIQNYRE